MPGSEIVDVAIGLILMFLLLSLVCSSMKEALETVMKYRSRDLERGLREIFGETQSKNLVASFYQHPLINGLFKGNYNPKKKGNLPSYIPTETFSLAVMDLLWPNSLRALSLQSSSVPRRAGGDLPSELSNPAPSNPAEDFKAAVLDLPAESNLRGALLPLIDSAGGDIDQVRKNIEQWYDNAMDRVSGWYKRRTQIIIAALGLLIAISMNVDTLAIVRYLNTNQTTRAVLIAESQAYLESGHAPQQPTGTELVDTLGWIERQGGIPIGWALQKEAGQSQQDFDKDWRRPPATAVTWAYKVAGLLFTIFAISLGAPFWFDVLNRIMVIRSTVKPAEKSQREKSKA